ncbi:hypothetical protein [Methylobacterium sp. WL2]|uniref:hypothetical protein n=1 Tax=unclassified Methylobacterium TaxID=2615210 RepID=UPI0032B13334
MITIAEIGDGIAKCRRDGASRKAARLSDWLETLLHLYSAQILPIDLEIARCIGRLSDAARREGHAPAWRTSPSARRRCVAAGRY